MRQPLFPLQSWSSQRIAVFARRAMYCLSAAVLALLIFVAVVLSGQLPTLEQLENPKQDLATQVYSADGELLDHFATTRRTYAPYDSIPQNFVNALLATEDREFRNHWGVHSMRILKAMVKNILALRAKEGASTLTQQLARNLYFTQEQTAQRKIKEAWTAFQIERTYTKNEILEMYANTVYYGRGAYGIRVASQVYFNKEPMKLSLAECAYLVGLFKAPERYAADDSAGVSRRNLILNMMYSERFINETAWASATTSPLTKPSLSSISRGIAPHFVELIRQRLRKDGPWNHKIKNYDLYRDGLIITTTLNAKVQRMANEAAAEHLALYQSMFNKQWSWKGKGALVSTLVERAVQALPEYISSKPAEQTTVMARYKQNARFVDSVKRQATTIQTGVVVLQPNTGAVLAMVGASPRSMLDNPASRYSLNHVSQIVRQPGSAFKPFVYAAAIEAGLTPESTIESGPFSTTLPSGVTWAPRGSSKDGGPVTLRTGLKYSTNSVAARLITEYTSPSDVQRLCQRMGITTPMPAVPAIALGAAEVSPMELTSAYGTFLNGGVSVEPECITRIEDRMGNVLYQAILPSVLHDAIKPETAHSMISIMRGVVDGGTASSIRKFYTHAAAGKTGTTNDFADAWFVGCTPQLACGVWVGFNDRRIRFTGDYAQGGRAAAPIWGRLMGKVYQAPSLGFTQRQFVFDAAEADSVLPDFLTNPPNEEIRDADTTQ
jgi:penicillin-binding protein 1A